LVRFFSDWGQKHYQEHLPANRFAQEVEHNQRDGEFLTSLGITMMDTPHGFEVVESHQTFAYTPGPEAAVSALVLDKDSPLLLTNELEQRQPQPGDAADQINGLNLAIQKYTSGKIFAHISDADDAGPRNGAFERQVLYGYLVTEMAPEDHGMFIRGGQAPHWQGGHQGGYDAYGQRGQQVGHDPYEQGEHQGGHDAFAVTCAFSHSQLQ
jgi:hypothetical protein